MELEGSLRVECKISAAWNVYLAFDHSGCRSPWWVVAPVFEANLKKHISLTATGKYLELMAVGGAVYTSRLATVYWGAFLLLCLKERDALRYARKHGTSQRRWSYYLLHCQSFCGTLSNDYGWLSTVARLSLTVFLGNGWTGWLTMQW